MRPVGVLAVRKVNIMKYNLKRSLVTNALEECRGELEELRWKLNKCPNRQMAMVIQAKKKALNTHCCDIEPNLDSSDAQ